MNILITGISKGLGLEIAHLALFKGMVVYGVSRSKTSELEKLLELFPDSLKWKALDLVAADLDVRQALFKSDFIPNNVPLHGFVNNAAIAYDDIVTNLNQERLKYMFQANVFTPMMITKYTIRNMIFNRVNGSIVHISSISVHTGYKGLAMYAGSKAALEGFSKNTAREWGEHGVRSNCLVAGFMETNMSSTLSTDQKNRIYNRTSMKKPTTLKSVAETILFLLGDEAESITGQNIYVDSGTI
jgi:3-oxoacyl-[acyl-carrier protein] reductase